ncbi:MAG: 16S rRNA (adenine(1518)-N(6)/adenine(1519)-N(6))-dimethyltransferase RsmA [Sulfuricella sp.]|nr:16S rRNA (adenine(1518)-N(6)/adenine(1519)-N(6))-dimethyltransferase RsmA [Sulfuricella sp.]
MKHIPRKRFGQNFLTDRHYIDSCIRAIHPAPADNLVEIGPGLGALTLPLLKILNRLRVVEIDRDIVARLERDIPPEKIAIHSCDALKFDFGSLLPSPETGGEGKLRVVGNLPYNISTPLLFHLADFAANIRDCHFMLQKEVVERMVAEPASPEYGRLSVMLQYRFAMEYLFTVPGGAFNPPPKVESAFVRMIPLAPLPHPAQDEELFGRIVAAAFAQRRKTLRNTLREFLSVEDFATLGIDPILRGETLGVEEFVRIANFCAGR